MAYRTRRRTSARRAPARSRTARRAPARRSARGRRTSMRGRSSARTIRIVVQTVAAPGSNTAKAVTMSPEKVVRARF